MTTNQAFDFVINLLGILSNIWLVLERIIYIQLSKHPRIPKYIPTLGVFNLLIKGKKRRE